MCWNAKVSLASLIVGVTLSIFVAIIGFKRKNYVLMALSLGWIWPILMQWIDYGLWKNYCKPDTNKKISYLGYVFNVLQPVILFLIFIIFPNSVQNKLLASIIIGIYIFYMLYQSKIIAKHLENGLDIKPGKNINYSWWGMMPAGGGLYFLSIIALFLLLIRPMKFSLIVLGYVLITSLISMKFFSYGMASVWCWFAVITPLVALFASRI